MSLMVEGLRKLCFLGCRRVLRRCIMFVLVVLSMDEGSVLMLYMGVGVLKW